MAVYVDELIYPKFYKSGHQYFCHLFADSDEELHAFAEKIGRKRCWIHRSRGFLHYDLNGKFRLRAIEHGARSMSTREFLAMIRRRLSI